MCDEKQVASWVKLNKQMKQMRGQDDPRIIQKIEMCERFQKAIHDGKCQETIAEDPQGRSAKDQLRLGGPYNNCLQDFVGYSR